MVYFEETMRVTAIIAAAGLGTRMGGPVNKHLLQLAGRPVLAHTLSTFQHCPAIDDVVLVGGQERLDAYQLLVQEYGFSKVRSIVRGGETRQESIANGLAALGDAEIVVVHDGARPLVSQHVIIMCVEQAKIHGAAIAAVPVKDTIKTGTPEGFVADTVPREGLWQVQTPQVFRTEILRRAQQAALGIFVATDDAMLVERLGLPVNIVQGDYSNIKITTSDDLAVAEYLLSHAKKVERV
jgi:2-C-methyl-D-erythritol 4-phosphate cytidylyltransferase